MPETIWTPNAVATMALAAATLILAMAVALDPLVKLIRFARSQPKSIPSQTKAIRDTRPFIFFWLPLGGLLLDVVLLINEMRSSMPLTRPRTFLIASLSACLLAIPLWMVIGLVLIFLTRSSHHFLNLQMRLHDSINFRLSLAEEMARGTLNILTDKANNAQDFSKLKSINDKVKTLTEKYQQDKADSQRTLDT
jgi:hypothetical protein